jgi:hypothetical protein
MSKNLPDGIRIDDDDDEEEIHMEDLYDSDCEGCMEKADFWGGEEATSPPAPATTRPPPPPDVVNDPAVQNVYTDSALAQVPVEGWLHPYLDARISHRVCVMCKRIGDPMYYICPKCGIGRCIDSTCAKGYKIYHPEACRTACFDNAEDWIKRVLDPSEGAELQALTQFCILDTKCRGYNTGKTPMAERRFFDALREKGFPAMDAKLALELLAKRGIPALTTRGDDMTSYAFWTLLLDFDTSREAYAMTFLVRRNQDTMRTASLVPGFGFTNLTKPMPLVADDIKRAIKFLTTDNNIRRPNDPVRPIYKIIIGDGYNAADYALPTIAFKHELAQPAANVMYLFNLYHMQSGEVEHVFNETKPITGRRFASHSILVRLMGKSSTHPDDEMLVLHAHEPNMKSADDVGQSTYHFGHMLGLEKVPEELLKISKVDGLQILQGDGHPHYWGRVTGTDKIYRFAELLELLCDPKKTSHERKDAYAILTALRWTSPSPLEPFRMTVMRCNFTV